MLPVPAFKLKPSSFVIAWVSALHGVVAFIPLFLPWPAPLRLSLMAVIVLDGWFTRRRLQQVYGFKALRVNLDFELQMQTPDNDHWQTVPLLSPCYLLPFLAILQIKRPGRRRSEHWLLLPGMMAADDWRKLRVWMKWRLPEHLPKRVGWVARVKQRLFRDKEQ